MKHIVFFVFFLTLFRGNAQTRVIVKNRDYEIQAIDAGKDSILQIIASNIGAIAIKMVDGSFKGTSISAGKDVYQLKPDTEHHPDAFTSSQLVLLKNPTSAITLFKGSLGKKAEIYLYYRQANVQLPDDKFRIAQGCDMPYAIPPSVWREGLMPPVIKPDSTIVEHVIVHHSATEISGINAVAAVRSIYLYHTTINGWDDIGYNYLIAPDGTIFQGRDAQQVSSADNIKGAHFCGHNANTMGICLLGNYMNYSPSEVSMRALESLIAWKLRKEKLPTIGSSPHPVGSNFILPVIAGHRDGYACNTDCPGTFVYNRLAEIRSGAAAASETCLPTAVSDPFNESNGLLFPSPATDFIHLPASLVHPTQAHIFNAQGALVQPESIAENSITISNLPDGFYFLLISTETKQLSYRFIKASK